MEEEKGGISLGDIFRIIFSKKWLALIIAAVITVAGTLAVYFGYNYIKEEYVINFTLVLPNDDATSPTYRYPDGQPFYYPELISKSTLDAVVEDGEGKYDGVKVDKMVQDNGISVSENLQVTNAGSQSIVQRKYTIKVLAKYFKSEDVARGFLADVANYPCKYLSNLKIEYDGALKQFENADSYLKQIDYLNRQITFIKQKYDELIDTYKSDFVVSDGKTLKNCLDDVTAYAGSYEFANLSQELKENGYLMSEHTLESYRLELKQVEEDLEDANFVLEKMLAGQSDIANNAEAVRAQAEKVSVLQRRQKDLKSFIEDGTVDTEGVFAKRLEGVFNKIVEYTETLQSVSVIVYTNSSKAFFENSNVVATSGNISLIMSVIISFVIGLVVAAVVAYIVGWTKLKKVNTHAGKSVEENEGTEGQQA